VPFSKFVPTHVERLPKGIVFLTFVFKETSSVAFAESVTECLVLLLALGPEHLKLSLDFFKQRPP
jgi:hypothetical protein